MVSENKSKWKISIGYSYSEFRVDSSNKKEKKLQAENPQIKEKKLKIFMTEKT